jgi:hypothetical protein
MGGTINYLARTIIWSARQSRGVPCFSIPYQLASELIISASGSYVEGEKVDVLQTFSVSEHGRVFSFVIPIGFFGSTSPPNVAQILR